MRPQGDLAGPQTLTILDSGRIQSLLQLGQLFNKLVDSLPQLRPVFGGYSIRGGCLQAAYM